MYHRNDTLVILIEILFLLANKRNVLFMYVRMYDAIGILDGRVVRFRCVARISVSATMYGKIEREIK